jgi:hypothetical protein
MRNCFGDGGPVEALFERLYCPGRLSTHSTCHERPYAAVAAYLMRKKLDPVVDNSVDDKLKFRDGEWKLIEELWEVTYGKITMKIAHSFRQC